MVTRTEGSVRRGLLLAGGDGTRLHPMTLPVSKQLLPVYDKPLVYYPLGVLMLAGIRDLLLVTTPRDLALFQRLLGDGSQWGMAIDYVVQERPGGIPEAYLLGREFLRGGPSVLMLGDNLLYGARMTDHLEAATRRAEGATIFGYRVRDPERFGVVTLDPEGRITALDEKPDPAPSPWAVIGLYALDGTAPDRAAALTPSRRGELEIVDLLRGYHADGTLEVELLGRGISWLDTGTAHHLLQAAQFVEVLQERQGLLVSSPDEIAFRMGYIDAEQLARLAAPLAGTAYGAYLVRLLEEL
jgi:glucose-1-phosphate thymidylyltransferase